MKLLDEHLTELIAKRQNVKALQYIADNNIDIKEKDGYGNTYLHIAAAHTNKRMIEFLIQNGADVNASNKIKETPLWEAFGARERLLDRTRNEETIKLLVELGADVTHVHRSGFSLYQMLVNNKFSPDIIDFVDKAATGYVDKTPIIEVIEKQKKERLQRASKNIMLFSDGLKYQRKIEESSKEQLDNAENICNEGVRYAREGQFEKARICFEKAAEMGLAIANGNLGFMYLRGHGVNIDNKVSFEYFLKAAELGNVMAMNQVADMLRDGVGVSKSMKRSNSFRMKAQSYEIYLTNCIQIREKLQSLNSKYMELEEDELKQLCDEVIHLIPEPKELYVETMEISYILGSYYENKGEFQTALINYHMAERVIGGKDYALLMYRIGSCCDTLGDEKTARSYFKKAFRIAGNIIFEIDDNRYLKK